MANLKVKNDPRVSDDLYSLSQFPDDRYMSRSNCIVNGVRFRCIERDEKFITQCSGVCTFGVTDIDDIVYYGVLLEILELQFIRGRKVFMFRCKWYNTDPRAKRMLVENNLTSVDITSEWYKDEPFILATQAQQVFYMMDMSRGKNWMTVEKVNHRNIFDILEHEDGGTAINDIFQEDDAAELSDFHPTEEDLGTSSLVREDIDPDVVPDGVLGTSNIPDLMFNDEQMEDLEENNDDEMPFDNEESILLSEADEDSTDADVEIDDDYFDSTQKKHVSYLFG